MNRLQGELQRLYGNAMVLELAGAGGWTELAKVWTGVQADLELPAPGIAVNGSDAYQLWFSFPDTVSASDAEGMLAVLRARYLGDVRPHRIRFNAKAAPPPFQAAPERWSSFVTPDLAALFDEGPWLDLPPGDDAQAELLSRLKSIPADALRRALPRLVPAPQAGTPAPQAGTPSSQTPERDDPRRFLLRVMNDATVEMRLRIEAARALLGGSEGQRR
jgi:hypothetical protein